MNTVKKIHIGVTVIILFCQMISFSQNINLDFEQSIAKHRKEPGKRQMMMSDDMQNSAEMFVNKHTGPKTIEFLKTKIQNPRTRKPALLSLVKLKAADVLSEIVLTPELYEKYGTETFVAIAYLPPDMANRIAEELVRRPGLWRARNHAVGMLSGIGDEDTLSMLKKIVAEEELRPPKFKKRIEAGIKNIEYRLTKVEPGKREQWAKLEILCWRTMGETPVPRLIGGEYYRAAEILREQGHRFPREFLEYKLSSGDKLGIAIIGEQKEAWAVKSLKNHAQRFQDPVGSFARNSLAKIGTREALDALGTSLQPGSNPVNSEIIRLLQWYGDRDSAKFLLQLHGDTRFSEKERTNMKIAAEDIQHRLDRGQMQKSRVLRQ